MMERRFVKGAGVRARSGDKPGIEGYGAVFNEEYVLYDSGSYRVVETVMPGAFTRALKEKQDVRCCFNHEASHLLGRTSAGTLRLKQDDSGLSFDDDLPDTTMGRDVRTSIERGDLTGCSFAFNVTKQSWSEETADGKTICKRQIEDVDLFELGPVTFPAYEGTSVGARAEMRSRILSIDGLPAETREAIQTASGRKKAAECDCRCVACARDNDCDGCVDHMVDCGDEENCRCSDSRSGVVPAPIELDRSRAEADVDARLRKVGLKVS